MDPDSPFKSLLNSFRDTFKRRSTTESTRDLTAGDESDDSNAITVVNVLATDPLVHDPSPSLNLSTQSPLFSTPISPTDASLSLFSDQPSPIASQLIPSTQTFLHRLGDLRNVDDLDRDRRKSKGVLFSPAAAAVAASLEQENGELRSQVTALRLQIEEQQLEISCLKAEQQRSIEQSPPAPTAVPLPPPPPPPDPIMTVFVSKRKKKKMRRKERETSRVAAEATLPPGCESLPQNPPLPPRPPSIPPPPGPSLPDPALSSQPTAYIFHDSNPKHLSYR